MQVRLYTVKEGKLEEFVDGWARGVRPLRLRHGFTIPGAWVIPGKNQFLWVLAYEGSVEEFTAQNRAYYDSEERKALRPDPAPLIERQETWFVEPVT